MYEMADAETTHSQANKNPAQMERGLARAVAVSG